MTVPTLNFVSSFPESQLAGRDDVIILGSALGTTAGNWDWAMPTISADRPVVRWELPGHGSSATTTEPFTIGELADGVIAIADSLGIDTFDYAGISVSGSVALELANRYPGRVKHAVVVCSSPKSGTAEMWAERAAQVRSEGTVSMVTGLVQRWFAPIFIANHTAIVKHVFNWVAQADNESYALICEALGQFDANPYLAEINVPVLVISGEIDPGSPPEAGAVIAEKVPGARQVVVPNTAHQTAIEEAEFVGSLIVDFFNE